MQNNSEMISNAHVPHTHLTASLQDFAHHEQKQQPQNNMVIIDLFNYTDEGQSRD